MMRSSVRRRRGRSVVRVVSVRRGSRRRAAGVLLALVLFVVLLILLVVVVVALELVLVVLLVVKVVVCGLLGRVVLLLLVVVLVVVSAVGVSSSHVHPLLSTKDAELGKLALVLGVMLALSMIVVTRSGSNEALDEASGSRKVKRRAPSVASFPSTDGDGEADSTDPWWTSLTTFRVAFPRFSYPTSPILAPSTNWNGRRETQVSTRPARTTSPAPGQATHHSLISRKDSDDDVSDLGVSLGKERSLVRDVLVNELEIDGSDGRLSVDFD